MSQDRARVPVLGVHTVPGWSVRALFAAVALPLLFAGVPEGPWSAVGALLTGLAVWRPRWMTAWVLAGVLLLSALVEPGRPTTRILALVAGVHALHLLGSWMLAVPAAARLQPAVLLRSLRRFVLVQIPVQAATVALLFAGHRVSLPALSVVSGLALAGLAAVLLPSLLRRRPPG